VRGGGDAIKRTAKLIRVQQGSSMRTNHADWLQKLGKAKEEIPPPKAPPPNGRAAPVDDVKATEEKVDAPYPVCPFGELDTLWSKLESRNKLVVGRRPEVKVLPPPGRAPKAVYKPTSRNLKPAAEERKAKNGGAEYDFDDFDDVFANVDPDAVVSSTLKEPRQPKTAAHGGKKSGSQSLGNSSLSHKQSPWVDEGDSFFEGVDVDALESDALRRSAAFSDQNRSPLAPTFQGECAWRGGNGSNAGCGLPLASRPDNFPHQQPSGGQPQRGRAYEQQMSSSHAESSEPQPRGVSKSGAGDLRSAIKLKVLRLGQVQQKYRDYIISSDPVPAKIHQLKDEQASLQCEIDTMTEMMLQQSADHATGSVGRYSSDGRRDPSSFASNPGACSNMYAASGGAAYTAGDGRGSRHDAPGSSFYSGGGSNFYGGSDSYDRPGADAGAYSSAASAGTGGEHSRMGSINSHELSRNSVRNYEASRHSSLSQQDKMPFSNPRYTGDLPVTMQVVRQRLFNTFGHRKFRDGQEEIVKAALGGKDVFVLIPTGGGKSLCYQLPAVCSMGLTVVFSPLIALVQDQVQALEQDGVNAAYISSEMDYESEIRPIMNDMFRLQANDGNGLKMLYITPEKLSSSEQMKTALKRLYDRNLLSRFIVDEAHCMSQWGHDFRPDYLKLGTLRKFFPDVPIMALTATANKRVMDDAINRLGMKNPFRVVKSFNRGNLYYEVRPKRPSKIVDEIAEIACRYRDDSGIIYCLSRRDCEVLAEKLGQHDDMVANHIKVDFYHADRSPHEKKKAHKDWSCGRTKVICATVAFGMGINKPDCRYVIHHSFPKSITNYYQESGRAGRDGADSLCLVFFSFADKNRLRNMLTKDKSGREQHTKLEVRLSACPYADN
jgi:bloom syndrome protein